MARYRIEFDVANCEGNFQCIEAAPSHFIALPGGDKADIPGHAKHPRGFIMLEVPDHDLEQALEAARRCPASVIRVADLEEGTILEGPEEFKIEKQVAWETEQREIDQAHGRSAQGRAAHGNAMRAGSRSLPEDRTEHLRPGEPRGPGS